MDDEPIARMGIKEYIQDTDFLECIGEAGNPITGMAEVEKLRPDILFLDIQMPNMTGMEYLKSFKPNCAVVLTTAYPEFAIASYELEVTDYLLKPIPYTRFLKSVSKVFKRQSSEKNQAKGAPSLFVKSEGKLVKVLLNEVLFIEALQNYVMVHTNHSKLIVHITLKSFLIILKISHNMSSLLLK